MRDLTLTEKRLTSLGKCGILTSFQLSLLGRHEEDNPRVDCWGRKIFLQLEMVSKFGLWGKYDKRKSSQKCAIMLPVKTNMLLEWPTLYTHTQPPFIIITLHCKFCLCGRLRIYGFCLTTHCFTMWAIVGILQKPREWTLFTWSLFKFCPCLAYAVPGSKVWNVD